MRVLQSNTFQVLKMRYLRLLKPFIHKHDMSRKVTGEVNLALDAMLLFQKSHTSFTKHRPDGIIIGFLSLRPPLRC